MIAPPILPIRHPIYLLGDHHGYLDSIFDQLDEHAIRNAVILHVGDGKEGVTYWPEHFQIINDACAKRNLLYLGMRGNHCDPSFFNGSVDMHHFKLVQDYTRLSTVGQSWLLVGGATSMDRQDRERGVDWWPEEKFRLRRELATPADVLVTHSGPRWIGPATSNDFVAIYAQGELETCGNDLIGELETERMLHEELFRLVRPKHWYFGHFHDSDVITHEGCVIHMLNMHQLHRHIP
jgi:hypothetical protein